MKNKLWIVEVFGDGKWVPTTAYSMNKASAELKLAIWKDNLPGETFRLSEHRISNEQVGQLQEVR
jgi:hypothetical protein